MLPTRKYDQNKLTYIIVNALKRAIKTVGPFAILDHCHNQKNELREYKELLERIESEQMDVSLKSRLE